VEGLGRASGGKWAAKLAFKESQLQLSTNYKRLSQINGSS